MFTKDVSNKWFHNFLTACNDFKKLPKLRTSTLLKIPCIGKAYVKKIQEWQKEAELSPDVDWVGNMIIRDAKRILEIQAEIICLIEQIDPLLNSSNMAKLINSIPGFGTVTTAELVSEIGSIERFSDEASLALYLGMAPLDYSSGKYTSARASKHVNTRAKIAIMNALSKHILIMPDAKRFYDKKRKEGKKHNQAVRAFGRHMIRVIWSMVKQNRCYEHKI